MAFILIPQNGTNVHVNGWNWRPTLLLLCSKGLISEGEYEQLGTNDAVGK